MVPTVAEVVLVEEAVPGFAENLVEAHVVLRNAVSFALDEVVGGEERHHHEVLGGGPHLELVQVGVCPTHGDLNDAVQVTECDVAAQAEAAPDRRLGVIEVEADDVGGPLAALAQQLGLRPR